MITVDFMQWIYPRLRSDYWHIVVPAQSIRLGRDGVFTQFFATHTPANMPSYTADMQSYTSGMATPDALTGKPSDVSESWADAFPGLIGQLREAQLTVNVFDRRGGLGFVVDTRVLFDGAEWQLTPTFTIARANVAEFLSITPTGDDAYIDAVESIVRISDNTEWREVVDEPFV